MLERTPAKFETEIGVSCHGGVAAVNRAVHVCLRWRTWHSSRLSPIKLVACLLNSEV